MLLAVDTSAALVLLGADKDIVRQANVANALVGHELGVPSPTLLELLANTSPELEETVLKAFSGAQVLAPGRTAARVGGKAYRRVKGKRQCVKYDALVLGTAHEHRAVLLTADADQAKRMTDAGGKAIDIGKTAA